MIANFSHMRTSEDSDFDDEEEQLAEFYNNSYRNNFQQAEKLNKGKLY